jgi:UDP-N-acetylglucosamine diphosphorylase / glucose-1-phosphate thymidylyltransferase / UDP-N-acetylgalactosamine diphosphorylase / glucosamine-1-phosphate N-acetyltransferase / galactosamine-1-phosphate N-acetyltransferase
MITRAVILAGGRGTRMRELTAEMPKPMVEVQGKPVLQHILQGLATAGFQQALIVVGYRKEVIQNYFGNGHQLGLRLEYVEQTIQDGTGRVVGLAEDFCGNQPFLLSYGDILVDASLYQRLQGLGEAEMLIAVKYSTDVSKGGAVYLDQDFYLVDLREKQSSAETYWYNAGIYVFRPSIFPFIAKLQKSPRGEYELTDAIRAMATSGLKIKAMEIKGAWADVRDPEILRELNQEPAGFEGDLES